MNFAFDNIVFQSVEVLYLLLLLPLLAIWTNFRYKNRLHAIPYTKINEAGKSWRFFLFKFFRIGKYIALGLLIIALARPQSTRGGKVLQNTEGIDIALAMDVSSSMLAMDFKPNRLKAAKDIAKEFIEARINDRFSLVVYAAESFTMVPITSDKELIISSLDKVTNGQLEDGTAVGLGLSTAVNRLKESKAKSKVVILLTDGMNNAGFIDPRTAADLAKEFGIRVYTIGVGTLGKAPYPATDFFGNATTVSMDVKIDEELLKEIASSTNGRYFRATSNDKLKEIYKEIDDLEQTIMEELQYLDYEELFRKPLLLALIILVASFLARYTILKGVV